MLGQTFYNSQFRKYVSYFGSLFDNIQIQNSKGGLIEIPISYISKDMMIARILQDPNIDRKTETPTLPIMSFEMGGIKYDSSRKIGTTVKISYKNDANTFKYVYTPVPYNINFRLYVFVKNVEDGTKIVESIIPYFTPDYTTKIEVISEMQEIRDIPIILNNVSLEDNRAGKLVDVAHKNVLWTLDFTMKAYFYGPTFKAPIIKFANVSMYAYSSASNTVNTYAGSTITTPGLTANGQPTSNSNLSVNTYAIEVTDDYGFITEKIYE